ncbi:histone deacetylase superfamily protein [Pokkaliibacter plantistimulans]|uniref:Histone deacetylase superfamily protein n=2 Tax=Pokkaliibacter plantistimulans TaxID=1635171 RepID=A0ABX5LW83_9GAMM|nr:histone deacetylase superfamily protein [Pokkaliibacter plantistimulans]
MPLPLVYHPVYSIPFPPGHRFPMPKFRLLYEYLQSEQLIKANNLYAPVGRCDVEILTLAHCPLYIEQFSEGQLPLKSLKHIGFPWSDALVDRTATAVAGTVLTAELALQNRLACHLAGGTHHAFYSHGSGFCIYNDLAVCARQLVVSGRVNKVLIIDLDVHQGDGTAAILAEHRETVTCSVHGRLNYPFIKQQSDWDIELEDGLTDSAYLNILRFQLPTILQVEQPDIILYDAGCDVHGDDRLGRMKLTDNGIIQRDEYVIRLALEQQIPIACVIGGGYDHDHRKIAQRHGLLHKTAYRLFEEYGL